jgi:hypothetical protein
LKPALKRNNLKLKTHVLVEKICWKNIIRK